MQRLRIILAMLLGKVQSGKTRTFISTPGAGVSITDTDVSIILSEELEAPSSNKRGRGWRTSSPISSADGELDVYDIMTAPSEFLGI